VAATIPVKEVKRVVLWVKMVTIKVKPLSFSAVICSFQIHIA